MKHALPEWKALRLRPVTDGDLAVLLADAPERRLITEEEVEDAKLVDTVARGRRWEDAARVYLAVEVSAVVVRYDLERARRRAVIIEKASDGLTFRVVAGECLLDDARQMVDQQGVPYIVFSQTD